MYERLHQISAWVENLGNTNGWKLIVQNSTMQPVYTWVCVVEWSIDGGGAKNSDSVRYTDVGIIPPGHYEFPWKPENGPCAEAGITTRLVFIDAHGKKWTRLGTGRLQRASASDRMLLNTGNESDL